MRTSQEGRAVERPKPQRRRNRPQCDYDRVDRVMVTVPTSMLEDRPGEVDARDAILAGHPEGSRLYLRTCPTGARYVVIPPRVVQAVGTDFAVESIDAVGPPPSTIRFNPESRGLVGVESWFWIEGYDGSPIVQTFVHPEFIPPITVTIELTYQHTDWDFGDGATTRGDLGRAYPAESTVRHAYDRSSGDTPYTVTATLVFTARYSVNGGAWVDIGTVERNLTGQHAVISAEAVRTR
ncbi:MAG: hypothetical protein ACLGHT_13180 [Acidimicrobiia bacterium]